VLARAAALAGVGLAAAVGAAFTLQAPLGIDPAYPSRVGLVGAAVLVTALAGLRRGGHPFARLGPANVLTGGRTLVMALVGGVALAPLRPSSSWLLVLLASIGATADLFDGPLARRSGLASRFGARFDMEVDALLILMLSGLVWRAADVGPWVVVSGLMRYAFIAAGWVRPWMRTALPPSRRRQTVCVVQIVALIAALIPGLPAPGAALISAAGLALLAWSFGVDVAWLAARRHRSLALP